MGTHQLEKTIKSTKNPLLSIESHAIFQSAKISMLILSPDGVIQIANRAAVNSFTNKKSLIGRRFNDLLQAKTRINFKSWYAGNKTGKGTDNLFLVSFKQSTDDISWSNVYLSTLDDGDKDAYILCQLTECSDRREIEEAKEQHEHFLSELINNIPDSIFIKDVKSNFILVNQSIANRLGFKSPDNLIGKNDFDIHPKKLAQKYYNDEQDIIRTGQARLNIVEQVIDRHNNIAWHSTSKLPLKDREGKIIGIMGIGRDITQWVKGQKALRKSKLTAEKADQLKTAFLSNFTHEIRTPLNGILGFSQYLKQTLRAEHKGHKYIDFILRNGKRLLYLISDIIDLSRIESGEINLLKKEFSLNDIMNQLEQSTIKLLASHKKNRIKLELKKGLDDEKCIFYSDDSRIKQILYNLLNNAVKFTNKGKISFGYTANKKALSFFVRDTGIGIDSKHLKVIFESFRQVDNSKSRQYEGAGLGLTISQGLVKLLDGEIHVKSELGKGTEFSFTIQIERAPVALK